MLLIAVQMNGPSDDAATAEGTGSANASKPWERVWTVDEMRRTAPNWHLANDVGVSFCFFFKLFIFTSSNAGGSFEVIHLTAATCLTDYHEIRHTRGLTVMAIFDVFTPPPHEDESPVQYW